MVNTVTGADFEAKVLKSELPVLVDFYADWCGPCKMTAPVLEKLSGELEGKLSVVKINVDEDPDIAQEYQVMSIPNLVVFKGGAVVNRAIGAQNLAGLKALIEKAL